MNKLLNYLAHFVAETTSTRQLPRETLPSSYFRFPEPSAAHVLNSCIRTSSRGNHEESPRSTLRRRSTVRFGARAVRRRIHSVDAALCSGALQCVTSSGRAQLRRERVHIQSPRCRSGRGKTPCCVFYITLFGRIFVRICFLNRNERSETGNRRDEGRFYLSSFLQILGFLWGSERG